MSTQVQDTREQDVLGKLKEMKQYIIQNNVIKTKYKDPKDIYKPVTKEESELVSRVLAEAHLKRSKAGIIKYKLPDGF